MSPFFSMDQTKQLPASHPLANILQGSLLSSAQIWNHLLLQRTCTCDAKSSASLYTGEIKSQRRVLSKVKNSSFISVPDKGGHSGLNHVSQLEENSEE